MKKILFFSILSLFACNVLFAQVEKGNLLLGGSLGFNTGNSSQGVNTNSTSNFGISPRISLGIGQNSILGTNFSYSNFRNKNEESASKYSTNSIMAGLYWKKMFSIKGNLGWYGQLGASYVQQKTKTTNYMGNDVVSKSRGISTGVVPGLYYAVTPSFVVNVDFGGVSYYNGKNKDLGNEDTITENLSVSLFQQFTIGFDVIISRKKQL
jgi:hypothetical protein